eukprot:m.349453 g.349453  ORF g.349453 m.349453 type:complete len:199 (+) comp20688_c1_seq14:2681-3277(+)
MCKCHPWHVSRKFFPEGPGADVSGQLIPKPAPSKLIDLETLIDEVTKGLHEKFSVKKLRVAAPLVDPAADNDTAGTPTVDDAGEQEQDVVPEDRRVEGAPQIVIYDSQDSSMKYEISATIHLGATSTPSPSLPIEIPPVLADDPFLANAIRHNDRNCALTRKIMFGVPKGMHGLGSFPLSVGGRAGVHTQVVDVFTVG